MREPRGRYVQLIESRMEIYIPQIPVTQAKLIDAMHYSLIPGGKHVRGMILMEFCRLCGEDPVLALPFACALEMIHTYSLIHDDLPCMDDDTMRRGRPCNHLVFGEDMAVLAGDALLTAAFETVLDPDYTRGIPPERVLRAAHTLAWQSGVYGMAGGQALDIDPEINLSTAESVAAIHNLKTGALFAAAAEIGCVLGGAGPRRIDDAVSFAKALGLAFQIRDDILGVEGSLGEMGKNAGIDEKSGKTTFVKLLGLNECKRLVARVTDDAVGFLSSFEEADFLRTLARELMERRV